MTKNKDVNAAIDNLLKTSTSAGSKRSYYFSAQLFHFGYRARIGGFIPGPHQFKQTVEEVIVAIWWVFGANWNGIIQDQCLYVNKSRFNERQFNPLALALLYQSQALVDGPVLMEHVPHRKSVDKE